MPDMGSRCSSAFERTAALLALALLAAVMSAQVAAQSTRPISGFWELDSWAYWTLADAGSVFLQGTFTYAGPHTGNWVQIDRVTGMRDTAFPVVEGTIHDAVPDGAGGWYIGGYFSRVGGHPRNHLAHVLADGRVSLWNPDSGGRVRALAVGNGVVYAGGFFTTIGGVALNRIAAVDRVTGLATGWDPNANNGVLTLEVGGGTVYAGGYFATIGGASRSYIAAIDASSGLATAWDPNANSYVNALEIDGGTVYAGGGFSSIGGASRGRIAALDMATGLATGWDPSASGDGGTVYAIVASGAVVYAGGEFTTIGGATRNRIAAIDAVTGLATAWDPNADNDVYALAVDGSTVYAGGDFKNVGGQRRYRIAALDATTGLATSWSPHANERVLTLGAVGDSVYAGGDFTSVGGEYHYMMVGLDANTGAPTGFYPDADAGAVMTPIGGLLYAGGAFTNIGGQARNRLAALDPATGLATGWDPNANFLLYSVAASGSTVYAVGTFTSIGGVTRNRIAAIDSTTGLATAWDPNSDWTVSVIAPSATGVYVAGLFTNIGGQARNYAACLDTVTGLATGWNPNPNNDPECLVPSGGLVYAGGPFTTIGGQARNRIAALDAVTGLATGWNPNADNTVYALEFGATGLYAGGSFTSIGGASRWRLAELDTATGLETGWNPRPGGTVQCLEYVPGRLYVGGVFTGIGDQHYERRRGFAALCLQPAPTGLAAVPAGHNQIDLSWTGTAASLYKVYRSRTSGGPYELLGTSACGTHSDTSAHGGVSYHYVVSAVDTCESDDTAEATAATTGECQLAPDFEGAVLVRQAPGTLCALEVVWAPASSPCGGAVGYAVYRDTSPSFVPSDANCVNELLPVTLYIDSDGLSPGTTYYYVVRASTSANWLEDTNLIRHSATPTSCGASAIEPVSFLTVTATDQTNTLQWLNPPGTYGTTRICWRQDQYPTGPGDLVATCFDQTGTAGQADSYEHLSLTNDSWYYYGAWVDDGVGSYSGGSFTAGRPFDTSGAVKWAYSTGATAMAPPGIGSVYATSNDRGLHSTLAGASGGTWPDDWIPFRMNAPAQSRPPVIPPGVITGIDVKVIFLGSQDGNVYAVDAGTGVELWATDDGDADPLGDVVQAGVAGMFDEWGAPSDLLFVGTRDAGKDNVFYGLNPANGNIVWDFTNSTVPEDGDNGDGTGGIGIISGQAAFSYANDLVYFTSRERAADSSTVWCLDATTGARVWSAAVGGSDASPILRGSVLYVGTNDGEVWALDASPARARAAGESLWSDPYPTNDGPVKGFVWADPGSSRLYFSTTTKVWGLDDLGGTYDELFSVAISSPSTPLLAVAGGFGTHLFVGGANRELHQLDLADPKNPVTTSITLGDGSETLGSPSLDVSTNPDLLHVGSEAGILYAVEVPLPGP